MKERLKSEGMCGTFSNNDTVEYLLQKAFEGDLTFCKYRADNFYKIYGTI